MKYEILRQALLTMPEYALEYYIGTVWRQAVLDGKIMVCGHQKEWRKLDADGYPYCAMCKVLKTR